MALQGRRRGDLGREGVQYDGPVPPPPPPPPGVGGGKEEEDEEEEDPLPLRLMAVAVENRSITVGASLGTGTSRHGPPLYCSIAGASRLSSSPPRGQPHGPRRARASCQEALPPRNIREGISGEPSGPAQADPDL
eukprot:6986653-Pyramimonas_sp.AAC.1